MNTTTLDEVMSLAMRLPDTPRKVELLEEAVRIADSQHDRDTALHVRLQLLDSATFGGKIERSIVAFGWILGRFDEDPDCFDLHSLLWRYKWIVANVVGFTTVSKPRIFEMEDDMERRFTEHGFSLQVVPRNDSKMQNQWAIDSEHANISRNGYRPIEILCLIAWPVIKTIAWTHSLILGSLMKHSKLPNHCWMDG